MDQLAVVVAPWPISAKSLLNLQTQERDGGGEQAWINFYVAVAILLTLQISET